MLGIISQKNRQLHKVAKYLTTLPSCFACDVEMQPCETIVAKRYASRIFDLIFFNPCPNTVPEINAIAGYLKHYPMCIACEIEGQKRYCEVINMRWAGREILRILTRPGWVTTKV
jgi:hypothetical protein